MRLRRRGAQRRQAQIDMTPIIDMVFILLIFFIVATSFVRETGVSVERPASSQGQALAEGFILVAITRAGTVHLAGSTIQPDDATSISRALAEARSRQVVIQADRQAPLGLVLQVQDVCLNAGAAQVAVGVRKP